MIVVDVVHPGEAGNEALDGVVGPGDPPQQAEHREADGDQHSRSTPTTRTAAAVDSAMQQLGAPEPCQPPELGDVDQPYGGVHDHRAQRGGREGGEQRTQGEHREDRRAP